MGIGDWRLVIGDWRLVIGDWSSVPPLPKLGREAVFVFDAPAVRGEGELLHQGKEGNQRCGAKEGWPVG